MSHDGGASLEGGVALEEQSQHAVHLRGHLRYDGLERNVGREAGVMRERGTCVYTN